MRYLTSEVAKLVGVSKLTLLRWLYAKKIPEPKKFHFGSQSIRIWSEKDVQVAREFKAANYRKKPRRKKAAKKRTRRSKP